MADPKTEVERVWSALHANSDRITLVETVTHERINSLEAVVNTRNELMRAAIESAVHDAVVKLMPSKFPTEQQLQFLDAAIERQALSIAFRRKITESTAIWAVIIVIGAAVGGFGKIMLDWAVMHGLWVTSDVLARPPTLPPK